MLAGLKGHESKMVSFPMDTVSGLPGQTRVLVPSSREDTADGDTGVIEVLIISEPKQRKVPSKIWGESIQKVWEVEPLECP